MFWYMVQEISTLTHGINSESVVFVGVSKDVTIQSMAWTCDGLFLCVSLSDATLGKIQVSRFAFPGCSLKILRHAVVLTNCGEPVQLYVQGNFGPALERKRIEEFKCMSQFLFGYAVN